MENKEKTAREIFAQTVEFFRGKYPQAELSIQDGMVYTHGDLQFNSEGFNLLYNMKRLVSLLEEELL